MSFSRPPFFNDRRDGFNRQSPGFNSRDDHGFRFNHQDIRHPHRDTFKGPVHSQRGRFENRPPFRQNDTHRHRNDIRVPGTFGTRQSHQQRQNQKPPPQNSFAKFRNIDEFRDFRRSLKMRKSMEGEELFPPNKRRKENETDDFIFISPMEVSELKDELYLAIRKKPANVERTVEELCQQFSRFQYHLCYKDYNQAKSQSRKKNDFPKQDVYFSCTVCDCYFTDKHILDLHRKSGLHQQVYKIYIEVLKLGRDYMNHFTNKTDLLVEGPVSEKVGVLVKLNDEKVEYFNMNVTKIERDAFVLTALEKAMVKFWPQPKSQFFCRCCNYSEFASQALLDRHMQSARHLEFDRHYKDAFCIVCQHHYGDVQQMRTHIETSTHRKASHLMEFTKKHATEYWNYWHDKDIDLIPNFREPEKEFLSPVDDGMKQMGYEITSKDKFDFRSDRLRIPFVDESESPQRQMNYNENESVSLEKTVEKNICEAKTTAFISQPVIENMDVGVSEKSPERMIKDSYSIDNEKSAEEMIKDPSSLDIEVYKEYALNNSQTINTSKEIVEEEKNSQEIENQTNDLDDYIVPLTGYMCTVCHETLSDKNEAITHKETNKHKSNVKTHALLFGP